MAWNEIDGNTLQMFAGGRRNLDVFARTLGKGTCDCDVIGVAQDRLVNPLQFDRGLSHLSPSGGRETFFFGNHQQKVLNLELKAHLNRVGVGALVEIIAIPTGSVITGLSVGVYSMDDGLKFALKTRNGANLPATGQKFSVPKEGCPLDITAVAASATALQNIIAPAAANQSEHFVYAGYTNAVLNGNADVLVMELVTMPTSGIVTDFNIIVDLSYDTLLRIYA